MKTVSAFTLWTLPFLAVAAPAKPAKAKKLSPTAALVAANLDALRGMNHGEIFRFSRDNGMDSRAGFAAFKKALAAAGIDYDALRDASKEAKAEALAASVTHELTLFSDAKARCQRFAICGADGKVIWYGRFFDDDRSFSYGDRNEQSATECATARKAVWFASKVAEALGAKAIHLNLKVDAQWLCTLSGKAKIIAEDARRLNVELDIEWIPGTTNPADQWTTANGFKKWSDNNLAALATPIA